MDAAHLFSLEGRVVLITGGSKNIGKAIAKAYVAQGARVYISARDVERCVQTAEELGCQYLPADVSTLDGVKALQEAFSQRENKLDILVNNAGAAWGAPFEAFPEKGWDKVMNLNLKSPFFLLQALYPQLKAAAETGKPAKVINIASIDGLRLNAWETYSYHASKSGLIHLTKRLAATLIKDNIIVSGIAPGAFASDMNVAARDQGDAVAKAIPAGRIGTDEDLAGAAIFLASRAGDYVVGHTLVLDGGLVNAEIGVSLEP